MHRRSGPAAERSGGPYFASAAVSTRSSSVLRSRISKFGCSANRAGHRVWSCPDVQATHLKRWTLVSLIYTDIFRRAVPWTRVILQNKSISNDLNTSRSNRYSAVAAWILTIIVVDRSLAALGAHRALAGGCNSRETQRAASHGFLPIRWHTFGSGGCRTSISLLPLRQSYVRTRRYTPSDPSVRGRGLERAK